MINVHSIFAVITLLIANYLLCQCLTWRIDTILVRHGAITSGNPDSVRFNTRLSALGGPIGLLIVTVIAYAVAVPLILQITDGARTFLLTVAGLVGVMVLAYFIYAHFNQAKLASDFVRDSQKPVPVYRPKTPGEALFDLLRFCFYAFGLCVAVMLTGLAMLAFYSIFKGFWDNQIFAYIGGAVGAGIGIFMSYVAYLRNS
ncbi:MAG: hypothetical protein IPP57_11730 [Candidatus Obscuribacter sp.]|jgi:hypothetical protein|nr:hypothetical protein [Candidatus Obscuribacter sp.]MBK7840809.1 hypothetical protein [Candidatus Obscuribacter sp.]MBK9771479.1 hypothetical protein [Candidatus Obscuribacter sp.]